MVLAQQEAGLLGHAYVGTEHLLLGLIREGEGIAGQVLERMGISLDTAREKVEQLKGRGAGRRIGGIPFRPSAKRTLEEALRESVRLRQGYVGTEHLLLGLLAVEDSTGARCLVELGIDLAEVKRLVIAEVGDVETQDDGWFDMGLNGWFGYAGSCPECGDPVAITVRQPRWPKRRPTPSAADLRAACEECKRRT